MNIPQIYLVEPYNAYTAQKGPRKKHWHEIIEEQELMERIIRDQIALQEASSKTLPPNSPATSQAAVGNPAGGAGGQPVYDFFHPENDIVNFSATPLSGDAPLTVQFTNLTTTPQFDTYLWSFGDGVTSTDANPSHVYQSGSNNIGYTASLEVNGLSAKTETKNGYISASIPTVTAAFTYTTSSGPGPVTASFINTSTNTSQTPSNTYKWLFGDGTTYALATPPEHPYANTGSFTASLQATGSYGIASLYTQSFFVPAPTLNISFAVESSSKYSPSTLTFTPTVTYIGAGTLSGKWYYGEYSEAGELYTASYSSMTPIEWSYDTRSGVSSTDGKFTASLQITESKYGISKLYTQSFALIFPTLTAAFITQSFGSDGIENSYVAAVSMSYTSSVAYAGNGTLTYKWNFGSSSIGEVIGTTSSIGPHYRSPYIAENYTASLQVTGSQYGLTSYTEQPFTVSP